MRILTNSLLVILLAALFAQAAPKEKFCLALGAGGLGDQSFNDSMYNGLIALNKKHHVPIHYEEMHAAPDHWTTEKLFAKLDVVGCKIIFVGGAEYKPFLPPIVEKYPSTHFVYLDDTGEMRPNLTYVTFDQREGSFVVGALAARFSKSRRIAYIGGVAIPVLKEFEEGFLAGIAHVDGSLKPEIHYLTEAPDFSGFSDPQKAHQLATRLYAQGVDVIYAVAGASGNGVIQAAKNQKKYVIGVDSNQDYMAKGYVLTSMLKRLDNAVLEIGTRYILGTLEGGKSYLYGYKNDGVGTTDMAYTSEVIGKENMAFIRSLESKIRNGEMQVISQKR